MRSLTESEMRTMLQKLGNYISLQNLKASGGDDPYVFRLHRDRTFSPITTSQTTRLRVVLIPQASTTCGSP